MSKKRRKHWKLSESGSVVFCFLMITPIIYRVVLRIIDSVQKSSYTILIVSILAFIFLSTFLWFCSIHPVIKDRELLSLKGGKEGFYAYAFMFGIFGLIVLITGYTPTRYNPVPIPRSYCIDYFIISLASAVVGYIAKVLDSILEKNENKGIT